MKHYQGEDIQFALVLKPKSAEDMKKWDQSSRTVAYFYTDTSHISKFSTDDEQGYHSLTLTESEDTLTGVIPSADTKAMHGTLYCDIYIDTEGGIEKIGRQITGIEIFYSPIKAETT